MKRRKRTQCKQKQKLQQRVEDDNEIAEKQAMRPKLNHIARVKKRSVVERLNLEKVAVGNTVRKQKELMKAEKERQQLERIALARQARDKIRQHENNLRRTKEKERLRKTEMVEKRYHARIREEAKLVTLRVKNIAKLEKDEAALIRRLQNAQALQKEAYNVLEAALRR